MNESKIRMLHHNFSWTLWDWNERCTISWAKIWYSLGGKRWIKRCVSQSLDAFICVHWEGEQWSGGKERKGHHIWDWAIKLAGHSDEDDTSNGPPNTTHVYEKSNRAPKYSTNNNRIPPHFTAPYYFYVPRYPPSSSRQTVLRSKTWHFSFCFRNAHGTWRWWNFIISRSKCKSSCLLVVQQFSNPVKGIPMFWSTAFIVTYSISMYHAL